MNKCFICKNYVIRQYLNTIIQYCEDCNYVKMSLDKYNNLIKIIYLNEKEHLHIFPNTSITLQNLIKQQFFNLTMIKQLKTNKIIQTTCSECLQKTYGFEFNGMQIACCYFDKIIYFQLNEFKEMIKKSIIKVNKNLWKNKIKSLFKW